SDLTLVRRGVGQHRDARCVADGVDAVHVRPQPLVYDYGAPVLRHARLLQSQVGDAGPAASGDEHLLGLELAAAEAHAHPAAGLRYLLETGTTVEDDTPPG